MASQGQELAPPAVPQPLDLVAAGQKPAALLPPVQPNAPLDPAQEFIIENFDALPQLGLGAYEAQDLSTVVYNMSLLDEATLAEADANGALADLLQAADPAQIQADSTSAQIAADAAAQRPQMQVQTAPAAPAMPAPKVPAGTQNALARARVRVTGAGPQPAGLVPQPLAGAVAKRPV